MTIILSQSAADLDPANTTSNPETSLSNYFAELAKAILAEYPEAEIETHRESATYGVRVLGAATEAEHDEVHDFVQRAGGDIYALGNFWA